MGNHRADHRATTQHNSDRTGEPNAGRRVPFDATDTSTTQLRPAVPGKRRAVKHAGRARTPLARMVSLPAVAGVALLAVSAGGVLSTDTELVANDTPRLEAANAASGTSANGVVGADRAPVLSRDSERDALADVSTTDLRQEVEQQAEQRNVALGVLAQQAEKEAKEINLNRWVLPVDPGAYRLTARYGEYGLWSSYHTGLDFAAPSGTPIMAVAGGVVTSTGYDGAYGNKTVVTLDDGTELWYCHQTSYAVSTGDTVTSGQVIGYVGSTGNTTGPHLHLEVRPGGGDPVDPDSALRQNGVTP